MLGTNQQAEFRLDRGLHHLYTRKESNRIKMTPWIPLRILDKISKYLSYFRKIIKALHGVYIAKSKKKKWRTSNIPLALCAITNVATTRR